MSARLQSRLGEPGVSQLDPRLSGVPQVRGYDARIQTDHPGRQNMEAIRSRSAVLDAANEAARGVL